MNGREQSHEVPDGGFHAVDILAETTIPYRPRLNRIVGSATAAILLQQITYWWVRSGREPFYKFMAPCKNDLYVEGDSWEEELAFTRTELKNALDRLGRKRKADETIEAALDGRLITWWTTRERLTYFVVNERLYSQLIAEAYDPALPNAGNLHYQTQETRITKRRKPALDIKQRPHTETTHEITTTCRDDEPDTESSNKDTGKVQRHTAQKIDYESKVDDLLRGDPDAALVRELMDVRAAENKSGQMTVRKLLADIVQPYADWRDSDEHRRKYRVGAIQEAITNEKPNLNWIKKAATSYAKRDGSSGATSRSNGRTGRLKGGRGRSEAQEEMFDDLDDLGITPREDGGDDDSAA